MGSQVKKSSTYPHIIQCTGIIKECVFGERKDSAAINPHIKRVAGAVFKGMHICSTVAAASLEVLSTRQAYVHVDPGEGHSTNLAKVKVQSLSIDL